MKNILLYIILLTMVLSCASKLPNGRNIDEFPAIFPDYIGVTIPYNIAPLNFAIKSEAEEAYMNLSIGDKQLVVKAKKGQFKIPVPDWKELLESAIGKSINVTIYAKEDEWVIYKSFDIHVAKEPIDPYIAYRLIEPGYVLWNEMGIYQRNLENYSESVIMENKLSNHNCMNCHSFVMQDPNKMLFHMRDKNPGTLLIDGDKIEKLNTKIEQKISSLVYPSWHPSGKYVAFSANNTTRQNFHMNDRNRVEVYDEESDVVVYDVEKHEILTTTKLFSEDAFETFPTFSPDGKTLYFCTAETLPMPKSFEEVKYSLCSVSFDPETRQFGSTIDTLYNAKTEGRSAALPRVSPDGKFLLYTLSDYGTFFIWHKDADLYMINLETKEHYPLDAANSDDVDSYHSWSSNSHWVVFSSRRIDGLYTRPYFAYINDKGEALKAFLLPQKDVDFYHRFMKSYNIPEFITGKVKNRSHELGVKAKNDKGIDVKFAD